MTENKKKRHKIISMFLILFLITGSAVGLAGCSGGEGNYRWGHGEGIVFESYAGPVFPLTFVENQDAVKAARSVNFDFSAYDEEYGSGSTVTDSYILHNTSSSDITAAAVYPFVGSFNLQELPEIMVDAGEVTYEIHAGEYAGGFTGGGVESVSLNLQDHSSWEDYADMLQDGSYFNNAFSSLQNLEQPVTVYRLYDIVNQNQDAGSASLCMLLDYDAEKTEIFTFGFNGGGTQEGTNQEYITFFIREWADRPDWKVKYLIAVGEDIDGYTLQGYQDGSCAPGEELDWPDAKVERFETTFGEALRECAKLRYDAIAGNEEERDALDRYINAQISFDLYYEQLVRHFMTNGPMGSDPKERYDVWGGRLDEFITETGTINRILYLTLDVTIPAGGTVALHIEQMKSASTDFYSNEKEDEDLNGYDMVTSLGTNLVFDRQSASISGYDSIEILRQNYGFDIAAGITNVELDRNEPRYYMEVRKVS